MKTKTNTKTLARITGYLKYYLKHIVISVICASCFGLFAASPSYFIQHTVDKVFIQGSTHLLLSFIFLFITLFMLKGVFMYLSSYYMHWVGYRVVNDMRYDLFTKMINYPASFFATKNTGELISCFLNDMITIQTTMSSAIRHVLEVFLNPYFYLLLPLCKVGNFLFLCFLSVLQSALLLKKHPHLYAMHLVVLTIKWEN